MPTPAARELADQGEQALGLAVRQGGGGLVHEQDARLGSRGRARSPRAAARPCAGEPAPRVQVECAPRRGPAAPRRAAAERASRCAARRPAGSRPKARFSATREVGEERGLLVDRGDAQGAREQRDRRDRARARPTTSRPESGACAPVMILTRVLLPAPFSPTSAWTSPGAQVEDNAAQRVHGGERLGDAADGEDRVHLIAARPRCGRPRAARTRPGCRRGSRA